VPAAPAPYVSYVVANRRQKRKRPDLELAKLARRQHGLVTIAQLRSAGLSDSAIRNRVRGGRLHRLHRGVYAVGHTAVSWQSRCLAAALAVGPDAVVSHSSAAALYGFIERPPRATDVVLTRQVRPRQGIHTHETTDLGPQDRTRRDGIPMTSAARTLLDLADTIPPDRLRRAVREAYVRRLVTTRELERTAAGARGRHGASRLAAVVAEGPVRTRSELEDRLLELLRAHDLRPAVNVAIEGLARPVEVDFLFADQRLVVEADGARFHDNALARESDADRQAMLEAAGYRVLRVTWRQATRDARATVERVRRALEA